jgi:mannose-1-phosphate guanylyltransferase/mannose-1-phosphate guanylyltransferase/mannose-6-phosphate isomerase
LKVIGEKIYTETMFDDCLIMAGGAGTRLWPASSLRLPKQFLPALEKTSFFSMAVERALAVTGKSGKIIIITGKPHIPLVIKEAAKLSAGEKKRLLVIGEPAAKNTAPAIACAAIYSLRCQLNGGKNRNMLVLTSDHIIKPLDAFKGDAAKAAASAKEGKLVMFGIPPAYPETGYGYIETGRGEDVLDVTAFHEKPNLQTAKKYAASRRFFWNSGMFAFSAGFIIEQFRLLAPDVVKPFEKLKAPAPQSYNIVQGVQVLDAWPGLQNAYRKATGISFDYAIAEKCQNTVMVRSNFDWIDVGNWEEYVKIRGNKSQVFSVSGENCHVDSDIPVALAGVEDLIVVIRSGKNGEPAAALVTKKGQTQKVREIVEQIKKTGKTELL